MNEVIQKLLNLQDTDRRRREIEARLKAGSQKVDAARAKLLHHQNLLDETSRRAKEAGLIEKQKFGQVEEVVRKIRDVEVQNNRATSNTEFQNRKKQIAGLTADRNLLEEEALQQAGVKEQREREAKAEKAKVDSCAALVAKEQGAWQEERRAYDEELAALDVRRVGSRQGIAPTWLDRYDRILGSGRFPVLVQVVEQYCQGCQMNLSIHDVTRAFRAVEVVMCTACQRMLYAETL